MNRSKRQEGGVSFDPVPIKGEPLSATVTRARAERDDQLAGLTALNQRSENNERDRDNES